MIRVPNLYRHEDGDLYCLLSDDAALKEPTAMGIWHDGVVYLGTDGRMRSTTMDRWTLKFVQVPAIREADLTEAQMAMIRRTNPGDVDLDFTAMLQSWHEAETGIAVNMIELAMAAAVIPFLTGKTTLWRSKDGTLFNSCEMHISEADLRYALENYSIENVPVPDGFRLRVVKLGSEMISD